MRHGAQFRKITNEMLFELGLSHLLVLSEDDLKARLPTLFAEGEIGVDIDLIEGMPVISSVKSFSPGAHAGLHTGFIIKDIDGSSVEQLLSVGEEDLIPPFNERNRQNNITLLLLGRLYGPPETAVSISYLDENGDRHEKRITRTRRREGRVFSEAMPPFFIEFESRRLEKGIGYIRFNHFAAPVDEKFIGALKSMGDAPGVIIDLRRNSGGFLRTLDSMARNFISQGTLFYKVRLKDRTINKVLDPVESVYTGPVVLIIDETSMSCSEIFASSMQAIGKAVVVGERSPGYSLLADWIKLPNGDSFMHTIGQNLTPDGQVVEERGVIPDIEVGLDREMLLKGNDSQLQAAIEYIKNKD